MSVVVSSGSNRATTSEGASKVTIRCRSLDGKDIGVCNVTGDATVGQLINQLLSFLPEKDMLWFQNRKFVIGDQVFGFDDAYTRFMQTSAVKRALNCKPEQELNCCIVQSEFPPA